MQNFANFVLTATERKDVNKLVKNKLVKQVIESLSLSISLQSRFQEKIIQSGEEFPNK